MHSIKQMTGIGSMDAMFWSVDVGKRLSQHPMEDIRMV